MAAPGPDTRDLSRSVLVVLFILGLTVGCLWILRPFLTALVGATTIAISTWPMLTGLERRLGGRRGLAIAGMMALLAIAILAPALLRRGRHGAGRGRLVGLGARPAQPNAAGAAGLARRRPAPGPAAREGLGGAGRRRRRGDQGPVVGAHGRDPPLADGAARQPRGDAGRGARDAGHHGAPVRPGRAASPLSCCASPGVSPGPAASRPPGWRLWRRAGSAWVWCSPPSSSRSSPESAWRWPERPVSDCSPSPCCCPVSHRPGRYRRS